MNDNLITTEGISTVLDAILSMSKSILQFDRNSTVELDKENDLVKIENGDFKIEVTMDSNFKSEVWYFFKSTPSKDPFSTVNVMVEGLLRVEDDLNKCIRYLNSFGGKFEFPQSHFEVQLYNEMYETQNELMIQGISKVMSDCGSPTDLSPFPADFNEKLILSTISGPFDSIAPHFHLEKTGITLKRGNDIYRFTFNKSKLKVVKFGSKTMPTQSVTVIRSKDESFESQVVKLRLALKDHPEFKSII